MRKSPPKLPIKERFESKFISEPNSGCWLWTASYRTTGYGQFNFTGYRPEIASRSAYKIYIGPIPKNMEVCHKCDTPACVNPKHLFLGSHTDNMHDSSMKKRLHFGEENGMNKLTEKQIIEIRKKYIPDIYTQDMLAKEYGVTQGQISGIVNNKRWRHV
jgi:DNA-directed RNA polymerase subunit H (RpoH/RPB5)